MLHHSPTRSRLRAIGQRSVSKLVRRMIGHHDLHDDTHKQVTIIMQVNSVAGVSRAPSRSDYPSGLVKLLAKQSSRPGRGDIGVDLRPLTRKPMNMRPSSGALAASARKALVGWSNAS
jgi:hypothetical protein